MSMETNQMYLKAVELEKENKEEAFAYYLQAAQLGHEKSMQCVAYYYSIQNNYSIALQWYLKLANMKMGMRCIWQDFTISKVKGQK